MDEVCVQNVEGRTKHELRVSILPNPVSSCVTDPGATLSKPSYRLSSSLWTTLPQHPTAGMKFIAGFRAPQGREKHMENTHRVGTGGSSPEQCRSTDVVEVM